MNAQTVTQAEALRELFADDGNDARRPIHRKARGTTMNNRLANNWRLRLVRRRKSRLWEIIDGYGDTVALVYSEAHARRICEYNAEHERARCANVTPIHEGGASA